jgi:hypothetical protein
MSISFTAVKGFLMAEIKVSMSPVYAFIVLGDLFSPLRYCSYFFVVLASFQIFVLIILKYSATHKAIITIDAPIQSSRSQFLNTLMLASFLEAVV